MSVVEAITGDPHALYRRRTFATSPLRQRASCLTPGRLLHPALYSVKLHEFFGVSERTTRRWQAAGADLCDPNELMHFLRNMERPAASVEERLADPDCHDDLEELLGGEDGYDDFEKEPVDLAAVRFRDRHDCVISAGALKKAGKEVGALLSELLVQIGEAADLGEEWNELVVRVALVCRIEAHPIGARLANGDG